MHTGTPCLTITQKECTMSVFTKWSTAIENRDADTLISCLHDDYAFVRHQSGTTMDKAQMSQMLRGFMSSDSVVVHSQRCLFENDEVMVEHSVMDFADGSREAVLGFSRLKDGLIIHTETGATAIAK
jgi:ketosteroid isomerase-like protein